MRPTRWQVLRWALSLVLVGVLLTPTLASGQTAKEAARVRVLLALDTDDAMGATWGLDGDNVRALVEHMVRQQGLEGRVTIDHFVGKACEPQHILDYYNKLDTGPDEALLFYYSGHGGWHGTKGHFMAMTRGLLYRRDLLAAMNKKKPRLRVVLTDCCANLAIGAWQKEPPGAVERPLAGEIKDSPLPAVREEPPGATESQGEARPIRPLKDPERNVRQLEPMGEERAIKGDKGKTRDGKARQEEPTFELSRGSLQLPKGRIVWEDVMKKVDSQLLRQLLFNHVGLVDINGCKVGMLSMGTYDWGGSVFTNAFILTLAEPPQKFAGANGKVSWEAFFPRWQQLTEQFARAYTGDRADQSPQAFGVGSAK